MAEIVRELGGFGPSACLVLHDGGYYRVSTVDVHRYGGGGHGTQTLVFPADEQGRVTDWRVLAGGMMGREEAIAELIAGGREQAI